ALGYAFPFPALGAVASLVFLFNEGNSMWGGNIPSTLAGEFAFSLGFGLAVLFFGGIYRGIETGRGWRRVAVILARPGLCHPVASGPSHSGRSPTPPLTAALLLARPAPLCEEPPLHPARLRDGGPADGILALPAHGEDRVRDLDQLDVALPVVAGAPAEDSSP